LVLGAVGAGLYVAYQAIKGVKAVAGAAGAAVGTAYHGAVDSTTDLLMRVFGPADVGTNTYHVMTFPDGQQHAVPANSIDPSSGLFNWTGYPAGSAPEYTYQAQQDSNGFWYAVT
jgi:hypothetical protein